MLIADHAVATRVAACHVEFEVEVEVEGFYCDFDVEYHTQLQLETYI